jgi:hypothetical protein
MISSVLDLVAPGLNRAEIATPATARRVQLLPGSAAVSQRARLRPDK